MTPEDIEKTIELLEKTATTCEELSKLAEKYPVIKTTSTEFRELCNPEQKNALTP